MKRQVPTLLVVGALTFSACSVADPAQPSTTTPTTTAAAVSTTTTAPTTTAQQAVATAATTTTEPAAVEVASCPTAGEPLETAKLYIEHNATDADTGVHGLIAGVARSEMCIWDPNGTQILMVDAQGQLNDLAIADLFFESREPPNDEYSLDTLRAEFPEGDYTVSGTDFEGIPRIGIARFTHDIPAEPTITAPELGEDEEAASEVIVSTGGLVISWEPVALTVAGEPLIVTGYEVILTKVDHDDVKGFSRPIYDVHVGPTATSLAVPDEFVEPATVYELEVLVLEASGNQTISLGFFTTA